MNSGVSPRSLCRTRGPCGPRRRLRPLRRNSEVGRTGPFSAVGRFNIGPSKSVSVPETFVIHRGRWPLRSQSDAFGVRREMT
jgi:hypothetical protein